MKYGLIGERLSHSFSKEIHEKIGLYDYELCEIPHEGLADFMQKRDFLGINVTMPYKRDVMDYLDFIDERAKRIGAVNTVVNKDGRLYGYNTDYFGMRSLIEKHSDTLSGKTVLILGGGGTSNTAYAVATDMDSAQVLRVSRNKKEGFITYGEAYENYSYADVIINTTPVGMYPHPCASPIELSRFKQLSLVIDAVYNPIRTDLILSAQKMGVAAEGGLYMLVSQAIAAAELFTGKTLGTSACNRIYKELLCEKENIVLIGMPGCGKTTVGKMLAEELDRSFFDTDAIVVEREKREITEIFSENGEQYFRDAEALAVGETANEARGAVISVGGGAVLREENVRALRRTGRLYFINRQIENIRPTPDRPLAYDTETLKKRYNERLDIYKSSADLEIISDEIIEHTLSCIRKDFFNENNGN